MPWSYLKSSDKVMGVPQTTLVETLIVKWEMLVRIEPAGMVGYVELGCVTATPGVTAVSVA